MIHQLNPTIDVSTPLGDCEAIFLIDYGLNVNTVWVCRMPGGEVKHFYSDDIKIYDNPMNGSGWDIKDEAPDFEGPIEKFPPGFKEKIREEFNKGFSKEPAAPYNPERLPEDGGRNKKKWEEIHSIWSSSGTGGWFSSFLDKEFNPPKNYHFDTWNKVYNWYVSLSQIQDKSFLDFLIEFYPAPYLRSWRF